MKVPNRKLSRLTRLVAQRATGASLQYRATGKLDTLRFDMELISKDLDEIYLTILRLEKLKSEAELTGYLATKLAGGTVKVKASDSQ